MTVAGGGAGSGFDTAAPGQGLGREGDGSSGGFESEQGDPVKVEVDTEGLGLEGLGPRSALRPASLARMPESGGLREG